MVEKGEESTERVEEGVSNDVDPRVSKGKSKPEGRRCRIDEGKIHIFIHHCFWSTYYIRQQSTRRDVMVIAFLGWAFVLEFVLLDVHTMSVE